MNRKAARRLQMTLDQMNELGQYGLLVTNIQTNRDSLVTSGGYTKKEAKEAAIRKADIQFGPDGYIIKNFTKL